MEGSDSKEPMIRHESMLKPGEYWPGVKVGDVIIVTVQQTMEASFAKMFPEHRNLFMPEPSPNR
jgi:hypothetical protein